MAILALAFGQTQLLESYFMLSTVAFCFFGALYLNQSDDSKVKNLLLGIGMMSCATAGGLYCAFYTTSFLMIQGGALATFMMIIVGIFNFFFGLLGIAPTHMY